MHYYQFNIADYRKDTIHLTPIEHYIYRTLIDWYYLDERPIPKITQVVSRRLGLDSEMEPNISNVLKDFFIEHEDGWHHRRINEEIKRWRRRGWFPSTDPKLRQPIDEWKITRIRIFERDSFTCSYCGIKGGDLECDHKDPVSLGGKNDDSNLTTACKKCNRNKSNQSFHEWIKKIGSKA